MNKEIDITKKDYPTMIINGVEYKAFKDRWDYYEILAVADLQNSKRQITMQFTRGPHGRSSGVLLPNDSIDIVDGIVIDATPTNSS
jgi:hypothetical protein